jgi:hypothetical protein
MAEQPTNVPELILEHVVLEDGYQLRDVTYDQELSFLTNGERIIAFGEMPKNFTTVHPPESLTDRPRTKRRFIDNAKGVGMRVGNQPTAMVQPIRRVGEARQPFAHPPIHALEINGLQRSQIFDARRSGVAAHIGGYFRHLSLLAQAKVQGDKAAIERVERPYDNSRAVRLSPPPSWRDEQRLRGIQHIQEPEMLLLRSRQITVRRIGELSLAHLRLTSKG